MTATNTFSCRTSLVRSSLMASSILCLTSHYRLTQFCTSIESLKRNRITKLKRLHTAVNGPIQSLTTSTRASPQYFAVDPDISCDCAFLGAFHKAIENHGLKPWYFDEASGAGGGTGLSVIELNETLSKVVSDVSNDSLNSRVDAAIHDECGPWTASSFGLFHDLDLERILPRDTKNSLRSGAEKTGLDVDFILPLETDLSAEDSDSKWWKHPGVASSLLCVFYGIMSLDRRMRRGNGPNGSSSFSTVWPRPFMLRWGLK